MNFKLLSFNERGLSNASVVRLFKIFVDSIPRLYVLFLQEYKLRGHKNMDLGRYLWNSAKTWSIEATPRYKNGILGLGVGCSGIAILLVVCWSKLFAETSSILHNQAQYIVLQGLPGGDIGAINVYAPQCIY